MPKIPSELKKKLKNRCIACNGKGVSSKGGRCFPCNGTGIIINGRKKVKHKK